MRYGYQWLTGGLLILAGMSTQASGLSEEQAISLAADLLMIKYENNIEQCATMGAKNMPALYAAFRQVQTHRATGLPVASTRGIEQAKTGYKTGLQQIPVQAPDARDQVELICQRVEERLSTMDVASLSVLAKRGVAEFGLR